LVAYNKAVRDKELRTALSQSHRINEQYVKQFERSRANEEMQKRRAAKRSKTEESNTKEDQQTKKQKTVE
jgi:hypothetical protein